MIRLTPHSFEGVKGIKGRHRLEEMDETEIAAGLGEAVERTLGRIAEDGYLNEHEEAVLADLLEASFVLNLQISFQLAKQLQAFPS